MTKTLELCSPEIEGLEANHLLDESNNDWESLLREVTKGDCGLGGVQQHHQGGQAYGGGQGGGVQEVGQQLPSEKGYSHLTSVLKLYDDPILMIMMTTMTRIEKIIMMNMITMITKMTQITLIH